MSASSKMARDAMSESSWAALAKGRKETCGALIWSVKWGGGLEVVGPWSGTEGGSLDPKEKMGHRSARTKIHLQKVKS